MSFLFYDPLFNRSTGSTSIEMTIFVADKGTVTPLNGTTLTFKTGNIDVIQNCNSLGAKTTSIETLSGTTLTYPTSKLETINTTIINGQGNAMVIRNNAGNVSSESPNGSINITGHDVRIGTLSDLIVENIYCTHLRCDFHPRN